MLCTYGSDALLLAITLQEAAVEALVAVTRYSQLACHQVLQSTTNTSHAAQQQQQQQQSAVASALGEGHNAQQQQKQQYAAALQRILHLMKQQNSRMRYLCASCVSHMSRSTAAPADAVQVGDVDMLLVAASQPHQQ